MNRCPSCGENCVPLWRALVMPGFAPSFCCRKCSANISREKRWFDAAAFLPLIGVNAAVFLGDRMSCEEVMSGFLLAVLAGTAFWIPSIRYRQDGA